jgi:hypothetical protein
MSNPFGKAKIGGNKRKYLKLGDGEAVYRPLPPMGDLVEEGCWFKFYEIHYGYKNSKGETRTFVSPLVKNNKTKMIEVPDAALVRIQELTVRLDKARKENNQELVKKLLEKVGGPKSQFNLDKNVYMNVMDLQGNIGILKIRYKCKLALDTEIKRLTDKAKAKDPQSDWHPLDAENGRYFVFSRTGTGRDTVYNVRVYKKTIQVENVGDVEQEVPHTIPKDVQERCIGFKDGKWVYKEAANLLALFKRPTSDQVKRIVLEGAKAVDEILDGKTDTGEETDNDTSGVEGDDTPVETSQVSSDPAQKKVVVEITPEVTAAPTPTVAAAPKPAEIPKTTAQTVSAMSDEELLKSLNL